MKYFTGRVAQLQRANSLCSRTAEFLIANCYIMYLERRYAVYSSNKCTVFITWMIIHVKKDTSNLKISSEAGSIVILFEDIAKLRKLGSKILNPVIVVKLTKCMISFLSTNLFLSSHGVNCTGFRCHLIWVEAVMAFWLQEQSKCAEQPGGRVWEDIIIKAIKRRSKCTEQPRGGVWEDKWGTGGGIYATGTTAESKVEKCWSELVEKK